MKFGAVPVTQLNKINFRLPAEPAENKLVLPGIRVAQPKFYIGAATWGSSKWNQMLYPPKTPASKYRQLYPLHFNAIELNATYYTLYPEEVIRKWGEPARERDFKFCPKFPQAISHEHKFADVQDTTSNFLNSIKAFGNNLGPAFIQLSEYYGPEHKVKLFNYLSSLPKGETYFLELRHPAWFSNTEVRKELFDQLYKAGIGAVITDTPGRRDVVHMRLTIPKLILRFVCNSTHSTAFSRTDDWISYFSNWMDAGLEEAYVFLHPGDDEATPTLANYWINKINLSCKLHIKPVTPVQPGLF